MRPRLSHPTHATVVAYLALFAALGGSAVAASGVLIKKPSQVGRGVITSAALKDKAAVNVKDLTPRARAALKTAGPAGPQGPAGPSTGPAGGALTGNYPNPGLANGAITTSAFAPSAKAPDANTLDGRDSTDFVGHAENSHVVGAPGEPPFLTADQAQNEQNLDNACPGGAASWVPYGDGYTTPAFFRDPFGVVHLSGVVRDGVFLCAIFQLPPGYRPAERDIFPVLVNNVLGRIDIERANAGSAEGVVVPRSAGGTNAYVALSGITFRCAPSGADGCP